MSGQRKGLHVETIVFCTQGSHHKVPRFRYTEWKLTALGFPHFLHRTFLLWDHREARQELFRFRLWFPSVCKISLAIAQLLGFQNMPECHYLSMYDVKKHGLWFVVIQTEVRSSKTETTSLSRFQKMMITYIYITTQTKCQKKLYRKDLYKKTETLSDKHTNIKRKQVLTITFVEVHTSWRFEGVPWSFDALRRPSAKQSSGLSWHFRFFLFCCTAGRLDRNLCDSEEKMLLLRKRIFNF